MRSLGYGEDAIASGDHLVWFGPTEPWTKTAPNPSPDALHITDLRTDTDRVSLAASGFIPAICVVSPDATKVAVKWGSVNGDVASVGIIDLETGAMEPDPIPRTRLPSYGPQVHSGSSSKHEDPGVGFGIPAYKMGAPRWISSHFRAM